MELATEIEAGLRELSAACVEVRENGGRVAALASLSWEVRGHSAKPLLHLWSEQHNLTRRVLAIIDHSDQRLALAVERFGKQRPDRLEFVRTDFERPARELSREEFRGRLARILTERFADETVESLVTSADLEHSLSGNYARGLLRGGSTYWALLAVPDGESADGVENALTFGLLWLDRVRASGRRGAVAGLRIVVPQRTSRAIALRVQALRFPAALEIYELDSDLESLDRIDLNSAAANLDMLLVPYRETQALLDRARADINDLVALAPLAITLHPLVASREVYLRFRGLAFARWDDGRIFFGANDPRDELKPRTRARLEQLVRELEIYRHPLASDTRHALYRLQPERWMESLVREDLTRVDASLDPRFVYAQVTANSGAERGILDLLAVTRSGRLAIVELKASEHIHLPLQAAGYWLRIRRCLERAEFSPYGYFPGVALQSAPPLIYLVAPALRFHPATDALLRHLTPEMEIVRVGLAENWRRSLRVVMRQ